MARKGHRPGQKRPAMARSEKVRKGQAAKRPGCKKARLKKGQAEKRPSCKKPKPEIPRPCDTRIGLLVF
jgi:hypothetical protein